MFSCTSSNLCPLEYVLYNWEQCQVCKTYQLESVFAFTQTCIYLERLAEFCDQIRARTQRTNYICSTDPSNPTLSKAQINIQSFSSHMGTFPPETIIKSAIHPICLTLSSFSSILSAQNLQHFVFEVMNMAGHTIFPKPCFGTSIPKEFNHNTNQSQHQHLYKVYNQDKILPSSNKIHMNYSVFDMSLTKNESSHSLK